MDRSARTLADLRKSIESLPVFVVLDSIYSRNDQSPIARGKVGSEKYIELMKMLEDILHNRLQQVPAVTTARDVPFTTLFSLAEMIVYSVTKAPDVCLEVMAPDYRGDVLTCHSLNVAFLSCRVGVGMSLPYKDITELVVSALLHDFGMTRMQTDCTSHADTLSKEQRQELEQHPVYAWRYFEKLRREFPWLLSVVLQEHKREHGQGYPPTTAESEELHLYARIIGVCDSLEALTHTRPFRKAFHPADAMKTIIEAKEFLFSRNLLRGAINSLSMYPVGSLVRLNSNCTAQVVESVTDAPLRPVVRVLSETDDGAAEERVDLSRDSNLYVTGLVYTEKYIVPENRKPGQE